MDPTILLKNLRYAMVTFWEMLEQNASDEQIIDLAEDIATMFDNLDTWLTNGGFLPDQWRDMDLITSA